MKKQKSMMEYMKSRASIGAPKGNLGGEPDGKYPTSEINSKKLTPTKTTPMAAPSTKKVDLGPESKEYKKYIADTDKIGRKKAAIRNLKKFAGITLGGASALAAGYYGLTKEVGGKDIKDYSGRVTGKTEKKRIWRWKDE